MRAMVLCAGLGTRLRPLSDHRAKPLVPVGDRPALASIAFRLRAAGVEKIVVNAHHRAHEVASFARSLGLEVSLETELLGTAGGLAQAQGLLGPGPVLVWNGDIVGPIDPRGLIEAHEARPEAGATLLVRSGSVGNVGLGTDDCVVRLRTPPVASSTEAGAAEFLGIHVLGERLRSRLPPKGCLVGDVYLPALAAGETLRAVRTGVPYFDIGSMDVYLAANLAWLEERGLRYWLAPGARVARRVEIERSLIGADADVAGEGTLDRCVVWPGAPALAPARETVFTPHGAFGVRRTE